MTAVLLQSIEKCSMRTAFTERGAPVNYQSGERFHYYPCRKVCILLFRYARIPMEFSCSGEALFEALFFKCRCLNCFPWPAWTVSTRTSAFRGLRRCWRSFCGVIKHEPCSHSASIKKSRAACLKEREFIHLSLDKQSPQTADRWVWVRMRSWSGTSEWSLGGSVKHSQYYLVSLSLSKDMSSNGRVIGRGLPVLICCIKSW